VGSSSRAPEFKPQKRKKKKKANQEYPQAGRVQKINDLNSKINIL
jgi:hypothetical protein